MSVGDRESYTIVNHVIEYSVRGGRWTTWGGVHPDIVAGLDDDAVMKVFISNLRTRHDPATGMRFRLVHREAAVTDTVMAEEMEDGRVAVPKDESDTGA